MDQKNVGDSVRAGCGDKPHVRFGRGGLVLLSNQDLAFYLTSCESRHTREPGKASVQGEGSQAAGGEQGKWKGREMQKSFLYS